MQKLFVQQCRLQTKQQLIKWSSLLNPSLMIFPSIPPVSSDVWVKRKEAPFTVLQFLSEYRSRIYQEELTILLFNNQPQLSFQALYCSSLLAEDGIEHQVSCFFNAIPWSTVPINTLHSCLLTISPYTCTGKQWFVIIIFQVLHCNACTLSPAAAWHFSVLI